MTWSAVELYGMRFASLRESELTEEVLTAFEAGEGGWVVPTNVDVLRQVRRHPDVRALVEQASVAVADGMPLIWASRLQGSPLPERVAGSSLIGALSAAAGDRGIGVFLLGGSPGVAERAACRLRDLHPRMRVGWHCPPYGFEHDPVALGAVDRAVADFGPGIYFCGLGFPKQERLIARLVPAQPASWFVACGASLSFLAGETRRAPRWMQETGLEWLHRLSQEPRRLFRRYVVEDLPFAVGLMVASVRARHTDPERARITPPPAPTGAGPSTAPLRGRAARTPARSRPG